MSGGAAIIFGAPFVLFLFVLYLLVALAVVLLYLLRRERLRGRIKASPRYSPIMKGWVVEAHRAVLAAKEPVVVTA